MNSPTGASSMPTQSMAATRLAAIGLLAAIYFIAALVLGIGFLASGVRLVMAPTRAGARRLLFASLIYLPALLVVMALDRVPL